MCERQVSDSGLLTNIIPGDIVLADRGFESVGAMQASLNISAFTKGKSQLSALEVGENNCQSTYSCGTC